MNRPARPQRHRCLECGALTSAADKLHRRCRPVVDELGLPEGSWVPNGRGTVIRVNADGTRYRSPEEAA